MKPLPSISILLFFFIKEGFANPVVLFSLKSSSVIQSNDLKTVCPTGYTAPTGLNWPYCYMVHTSYATRDQAAAQCKLDNGTLASVGNGFVNSLIYSLAQQEEVKNVWLGLQCFNGNISTCVNDDNTPFIYNNFFTGQPRGQPHPATNCVVMSALGRDSQTWSTFSCDQDTFQFVCEVAAGSYNMADCINGWTEFQGMCYKKFSTHGGTIRDNAAEQCEEAKGGKLATINSEEVNTFLTSLPCDNDSVRIGLQCPNAPKKGDTSTCVWDDGTPFSYSNFAPGQPIRSAKKYCGYSTNGTWYADLSCDSRFTCEACQSPKQSPFQENDRIKL